MSEKRSLPRKELLLLCRQWNMSRYVSFMSITLYYDLVQKINNTFSILKVVEVLCLFIQLCYTFVFWVLIY